MKKSPDADLDNLANAYAARWAAERPLPDGVGPANRTELHRALEANEVFFSRMEMLPDYACRVSG